jgi:hypothetical protein
MTEARQDRRTANGKRSAYPNGLPIAVYRSRRRSHTLPVAVDTTAHRAGGAAQLGTETGSP